MSRLDVEFCSSSEQCLFAFPTKKKQRKKSQIIAAARVPSGPGLGTGRLPMTRSGKIMRRILRKIVAGEIDSLGDTSTLADPSIVDTLIEKVHSLKS